MAGRNPFHDQYRFPRSSRAVRPAHRHHALCSHHFVARRRRQPGLLRRAGRAIIGELDFAAQVKTSVDIVGVVAEYADADTKLRAALYQMHEVAEQAFRASLQGAAGAEARTYLAKRGVGSTEIDLFGLGYAGGGGHFLTNLFQKHDFPSELMEQSGLVMRRDGGGSYDRFRNRLMFPIHNE